MGVRRARIPGLGSDWLNQVRFDIAAKAATPAKEAKLRQMLQNVLAERFKTLESQLGLKVSSKKVPMDTIVIDSIEKTPAEN